MFRGGISLSKHGTARATKLVTTEPYYRDALREVPPPPLKPRQGEGEAIKGRAREAWKNAWKGIKSVRETSVVGEGRGEAWN